MPQNDPLTKSLFTTNTFPVRVTVELVVVYAVRLCVGYFPAFA
jgi:hypothetical protein